MDALASLAVRIGRPRFIPQLCHLRMSQNFTALQFRSITKNMKEEYLLHRVGATSCFVNSTTVWRDVDEQNRKGDR